MIPTKSIIALGVAFALGLFVAYSLLNQSNSMSGGNISTESQQVIAYELKKLNKMVVAEQDYSQIFSYKQANSVLGMMSFDKKIAYLVKAKTQVSYDLAKMKTTLDTIKKAIVIDSIPESKIDIFPDVEVLDMDQSMVNQFKKEDLNGIKANAIKSLSKKIDTVRLRNEGQEKLLTNLKDLYAIAKIYGWEVVDNTGKLSPKTEAAPK